MNFIALQLGETYEAANQLGVVATLALLFGVVVVLVVPAIIAAFAFSLRSEARTRQHLFDELQRRSVEIVEARETEAERRSEFKRFSDEQVGIMRGLSSGVQKLTDDLKKQGEDVLKAADKNHAHLENIVGLTIELKTMLNDTRGELNANQREILLKAANLMTAMGELKDAVLAMVQQEADKPAPALVPEAALD